MPQHSPHTLLGYHQAMALPGLLAPVHVVVLDGLAHRLRARWRARSG